MAVALGLDPIRKGYRGCVGQMDGWIHPAREDAGALGWPSRLVVKPADTWQCRWFVSPENLHLPMYADAPAAAAALSIREYEIGGSGL